MPIFWLLVWLGCCCVNLSYGRLDCFGDTSTFSIVYYEQPEKKSRQFATPPLVSPRNDVWETSAEIPYWWRVTTRIWVVLLIGCSKFTTNRIRSTIQIKVMKGQRKFCARFSDVISRETSGGVTRCRPFSQAILRVVPLSSSITFAPQNSPKMQFNSTPTQSQVAIPVNREEKLLRHVAIIAKFLDDNKPKTSLKSAFVLFQTSSILFSFI